MYPIPGTTRPISVNHAHTLKTIFSPNNLQRQGLFHVTSLNYFLTAYIILNHGSLITVCPGSSDPFYIAILLYKIHSVHVHRRVREGKIQYKYILYSKLLYKMGHYFLDIQYMVNRYRSRRTRNGIHDNFCKKLLKT